MKDKDRIMRSPLNIATYLKTILAFVTRLMAVMAHHLNEAWHNRSWSNNKLRTIPSNMTRLAAPIAHRAIHTVPS
jgi:hypothetical protein